MEDDKEMVSSLASPYSPLRMEFCGYVYVGSNPFSLCASEFFLFFCSFRAETFFRGAGECASSFCSD
ncbi:MAG: hypothetical protein DLD55_01585 [candidate division SR1 bacterium]|nr:MAG: hypothetical protein DLD55_01585 [candidate division SR1 bacterium]